MVTRFSSFSQQDSQEFLNALLENVHNALTTTGQQASVVIYADSSVCKTYSYFA